MAIRWPRRCARRWRPPT